MVTYIRHDPLSHCVVAATFTIELVNYWIAEFLTELGSASERPRGLNDDRWFAAREAIHASVGLADENGTYTACVSYRTRAAWFLAAQRAKLKMPVREYPQ